MPNALRTMIERVRAWLAARRRHRPYDATGYTAARTLTQHANARQRRRFHRLNRRYRA